MNDLALKIAQSANPTLVVLCLLIAYTTPRLISTVYESRSSIINQLREQINFLKKEIFEFQKRIDELEKEIESWMDRYYEMRQQFENKKHFEGMYSRTVEKYAEVSADNVKMKREIITLRKKIATMVSE